MINPDNPHHQHVAMWAGHLLRDHGIGDYELHQAMQARLALGISWIQVNQIWLPDIR